VGFFVSRYFSPAMGRSTLFYRPRSSAPQSSQLDPHPRPWQANVLRLKRVSSLFCPTPDITSFFLVPSYRILLFTDLDSTLLLTFNGFSICGVFDSSHTSSAQGLVRFIPPPRPVRYSSKHDKCRHPIPPRACPSFRRLFPEQPSSCRPFCSCGNHHAKWPPSRLRSRYCRLSRDPRLCQAHHLLYFHRSAPPGSSSFSPPPTELLLNPPY